MEELIQRKEVQWAAMAFLVGVVLGLVALGWWLWPVVWTDALPAELREDQQEVYVLTVAQAYELTGDAALARQRLASFDEGVAGTLVLQAARNLDREGKVSEAQQLRRLASDLNLRPGPPAPQTPSLAERLSGRWLTTILPLALLAVAVLIGVVIFSRRSQLPLQPTPPPQATPPPVERTRPRLQTFTASYSLGDDEYKQSFYIDSPTGELLGECGVKRSMAVGEGPPDRITAFEVWLFDKRDIRTTTKVLASPFAYHGEEPRSKLLVKGDVIMAQPGSLLLLETGELTLEAEVLQCVFSQDESMGPKSYFDRLVVQLTPMIKGQHGA